MTSQQERLQGKIDRLQKRIDDARRVEVTPKAFETDDRLPDGTIRPKASKVDALPGAAIPAAPAPAPWPPIGAAAATLSHVNVTLLASQMNPLGQLPGIGLENRKFRSFFPQPGAHTSPLNEALDALGSEMLRNGLA